MDTDVVIQSLVLMGQGMLAIFVVIVAIYLSVLLLLKLTNREKKEPKE